jgi:hypothetical protein
MGKWRYSSIILDLDADHINAANNNLLQKNHVGNVGAEHYKWNLKGSDDDVDHTESLVFWTLSIVRNSIWLEKRRFRVPWTELAQGLRLALAEGRGRGGVAVPAPEDGSIPKFRTVYVVL